MSSITGRANFLLTTSTGGGIQMGVKKPTSPVGFFTPVIRLSVNSRASLGVQVILS
ncbi:hypothetical protein NE321_23035 (plasmid) [Salmonella enterica subsp. indica serovar 11:b:e,n,x]|uniref:Uncharacterized protein n=1 Tax=Salmonella enterica subsp. indica TaxID=59207 RepID=I3W3W4_SALER|nr:hypothetical protein [Salmonella enterica subsp. indica]